jgi:hypothetical protein
LQAREGQMFVDVFQVAGAAGDQRGLPSGGDGFGL